MGKAVKVSDLSQGFQYSLFHFQIGRTFRSLVSIHTAGQKHIYQMEHRLPQRFHLDTSNQHWCNYAAVVMTIEHKVPFPSIAPSCERRSKPWMTFHYTDWFIGILHKPIIPI